MRPLDPTVLGQLYRQHAPALRLYARQWAGSSDDLVHDAFVALAQQVPPPECVLPWLYRVVRNGARAAHRATDRRRKREQRTVTAEAWFESADDHLDAHEASRRLGELDLELREVIVARVWGGLTFEEIAVLVGCSTATAQRRYVTGLDRLRKRLDGS